MPVAVLFAFATDDFSEAVLLFLGRDQGTSKASSHSPSSSPSGVQSVLQDWFGFCALSDATKAQANQFTTGLRYSLCSFPNSNNVDATTFQSHSLCCSWSNHPSDTPSCHSWPWLIPFALASFRYCDMKGTLAPKVIPWWTTLAAGPDGVSSSDRVCIASANWRVLHLNRSSLRPLRPTWQWRDQLLEAGRVNRHQISLPNTLGLCNVDVWRRARVPDEVESIRALLLSPARHVLFRGNCGWLRNSYVG